MINNLKVVVVLPAYNAELTLQKTLQDIPCGFVDEFILVDDCGKDGTYQLATQLGIKAFRHEKNLGYGGNQKSCYKLALEANADIVIMLHPDYQYEPKLIPAMATMISSGVYDVVLGSRILGKGALKGGMPYYKYFSNRVLTLIQNILINQKLSEYHTGYRAFTKEALLSIDYQKNSNDFIFDNEMIAQLHMKKFRFGEISVPTKYFPEASSINFQRSVTYGLGVLKTSLIYRLHKLGLIRSPLFK